MIIFFSAYCNKKDIKGIFYISKLFIDNKILENVNNKWILLFMSAIVLCCISLVMISRIPPLRKINKIKPIDCIRCKHQFNIVKIGLKEYE